MPAIPIVTELDGTQRLVLVELQGKLETDTVQLSGLELGELDITSEKPTLVIGNQKLLGRVVNLKKPIVLLENSSTAETKMRISHVIREKYLFDSRPTTVFSNKSPPP